MHKVYDILHRIALWGPPASGKTWLLYAFIKSLDKYNYNDSDFYYDLWEYKGGNQNLIENIFIPRNEPTTQPTDYLWKFLRRPKDSTHRQQISTHAHHLLIHDFKGSTTLLLDDPIKDTYLNTNFIVVILDPTRLTIFYKYKKAFQQSDYDEEFILNEQDIQPNQDEKTKLTPEEYTKYTGQLLKLLTKSDNRNLQIAICVTKSDQWGKQYAEEEIIPAAFGPDMQAVISTIQRQVTNTKIYYVSATGFLLSEKSPNHDSRTSLLIDASHWQPVHVEEPFFDFFENIEIQKLKQTKGLMDCFFRDEYINHYIKYKNLD